MSNLLNALFAVALLITIGRSLEDCFSINSCIDQNIAGDALCRGTGSCLRATIGGFGFCTGTLSCDTATIVGDALCEGGSSCLRAAIGGIRSAGGEFPACLGATVSGNALCSGEDSCRNANILGNACCSGENSCVGANIVGDRITEDCDEDILCSCCSKGSGSISDSDSNDDSGDSSSFLFAAKVNDKNMVNEEDEANDENIQQWTVQLSDTTLNTLWIIAILSLCCIFVGVLTVCIKIRK